MKFAGQVSPDFRDNHLAPLRADSLSVIAITTGVVGYIWLALVIWPVTGAMAPASAWLGAGFLTLAVIASYRLKDDHLLTAAHVLIWGILITITLVIFMFHSLAAAYLFILPVIFASVLLDKRAVFWVAAVTGLMPGQTEGRRIKALVQSPDLTPTILEMAGLVATETIGGESRTQALQCGVFYTDSWQFRPETLHGRSLMPLIRGETERLRDIAVSSNTLIHHTPILAKGSIVTEDGWCLHYAGNYDDLDRDASMWISKLIDPKGARIPTEPALFYLPDDPQELNDVLDQNEGLAKEIHRRYVSWLEEIGTPQEHLAGRRKLR